MSLGIALNSAISGLKLNQNALSVLSNNLANVNTEGYSRKEISQAAVYVEGQGVGVRIDDVVRKVDNYLTRSMQNQASESERLNTISGYYSRVQVLLGQPGATNSLDEYMTTFFNSVSLVSDQPERTSYRSNLVNSANQLAQAISGTATELESLRFEADKEINASVTTVNAALDKLYDLNVAIGAAKGIGQSTAGLLDERDMALKKLAEQVNIDVFYEPNGAVTVTTGNGVALVDGVRHHLAYSPTTSLEAFPNDQRLNALQVISVSSDGQTIGTPSTLVTAGKSDATTSTLSGGKIQGLVELRDKLLPDMLDQLDMMASRLRDSMNAINNSGSGYPPAQSLTADRAQFVEKQYDWTGSVRIAVLNADGSPIPSPYASESYTGIRPLTIDLSTLQTSGENGRFDMATLINEINSAYGTPNPKTSLGDINNIRLVGDSTQIPTGASTRFKFDLDLENISDLGASVFVQNVTVKDAGGVDITNVTQDAPHLTMNGVDTYSTITGEAGVDVRLQSTEGLHVGDTIYLGSPSTPDVNGIPAIGLTGYFTIENVSGDKVRITAKTGTANTSIPLSDATGVEVMAAYQKVAPGETARARENGPLEVDLSSNITTPYYEITLDVASVNEHGVLKTSQITYRVENNQGGLNGRRFASTSATGDAVREAPNTTQGVMRAMLVDEEGNEIPMSNGSYPSSAKGYLKLQTSSGSYAVAIDEMDSKQLGDQESLGITPASNLGFSSYFGMNNFFASNKPVEGGDTLKNSAVNLKVEQRIIDNPNLISTGQLEQSAQTGSYPQYTYVRYSGDNSVIQKMASLSSDVTSFDAAGGMPSTKLSLQAYVSEMLGYMGSLAAGADDAATNAQTLYDGFSSRAQAASGVNLDEELANTVIFQNAYSATARIVSVVDEMFKTLIDVT